jgi:prepilin-type N-terminal cleavage/methylation domain-containing protein
MRQIRRGNRGFTLIEMIVAVALFAFVMVIAGATLLSLVYANRKAQALETVINNLDISLDGMVRAIREGSNYRCDNETPVIPPGPPTDPNYGDCPGGGNAIYFTPFGADPTDESVDAAYIFDSDGSVCGKDRLCKIESGTGGYKIAITTPDVSISSMTFYVVGTEPDDAVQPKVVITVKGTAGDSSSKTTTAFNIQSSAVQRSLNI